MDVGARPEMVWILLQGTLIFFVLKKKNAAIAYLEKYIKNWAAWMGLRARILLLEFRKLKEKIERHKWAWEPTFYHWNLVN